MMAKRLQFSILGDSISTFQGCNPEGFRVYYEGERRKETSVLSPADTWWAQVIDRRGGQPLRNGSFSGSMVEGAGFPAANSVERIAALSKDGAAPDTILVFIGINDYGWGGADAQAAGRGGALPQSLDLSCIPECTAGAAPSDAAELFGAAYRAMLARLRAAYPQAEVWCCTLCPGRVAGRPSATFAYRLRGIPFDRYNDVIRVSARQNGCHVADVRALGRDYEALDGTHPTKRGMRQLAQLVLRAIEIEEQGDRKKAPFGESDAGSGDAALADALPDGGCSPDTSAANIPLPDSADSPSAFGCDFAGAPLSAETCDEPTCIGCPHAASTGNQWLCVCKRD